MKHCECFLFSSNVRISRRYQLSTPTFAEYRKCMFKIQENENKKRQLSLKKSWTKKWTVIQTYVIWIEKEPAHYYRSTVKQTKFHVEATSPPQRNNSPFQIEHSRSPNIPSDLALYASLIVRVVKSSIREQRKSMEL